MFGSHLSIAGSPANAIREARRLGLDCVQIFTKNQQQWKAPPLTPPTLAEWDAELRASGWRAGGDASRPAEPGRHVPIRVVAHASYLINLASPDPELWSKSVDAMVIEVQRCADLGIPVLVHHPGSSTGSPAALGIDNVVRGYERVLKLTGAVPVTLCLENTVGGGSTLGASFEQLATLRARIVDATGAPHRVGFCIDTCHAHAAGHDLAAPGAAESVLQQIAGTLGIEHVRVLHLNDSKAPSGSRLDRHEHIGKGTIGLEGFRAVVNHPAFATTPKILETPKGTTPAGTPHDTLNLRRLKKLMS